MGEPRRIELTQVSTGEKKEKPKKRPRNVRFKLSLAESNNQTCPEFSYAELLKKSEEENDDAGGNVDPDDPFAEKDQAEHDKMVALAKSFESKYGHPGQKKPKHKRVNDLIDLGDGYDESDPFIDNSDAYDELVPECLTTKHGGFYINSGLLDFREVSMSHDDDAFDAIVTKKRKKKMMLLSDTDSEKEIRKRGRPKKKLFGEELLKKRKKRLGSDGSEKPLKKKKLIHVRGKPGRPPKKLTQTVAQLLGQSNQTLPGPVQNGTHATAERTLASSATATCSDSEESHADDGAKPSTLTQENYDDIFEAVIRNSSQDSSMSPKPSANNETATSQNQAILSQENAPSLPDVVTGALLDAIVTIKMKSKESADGKCKFFTPEVNSLLLKIENESRQLPGHVRTNIYGHLAAHLPCGKETLIKRAKKLRISQHDDKLLQPIAKLKEAVQHAMPRLIEKYQVELQATEKAKQERKMEDKGGATMPKGEGSTESDEEVIGEGQDKLKRIMAPRKKFGWTPEIRSLLCDVVRIKMELYEMQKIRSQAPEDYLRSFLDAEVKPLWPQGWMQTRMLFKESRMVHHRWTMEKARIKRPISIAGLTSPSAVNPVLSMPCITQAVSSTSHTSPASRGMQMPELIAEFIPPVPTNAAKADSVHRVGAGSDVAANPGLTLLDYAEVSSTSESGARIHATEVKTSPSSIASHPPKSLTASMLSSHDAEQKYLQERALQMANKERQAVQQTSKKSSSTECLDNIMEYAASLRAQDKSQINRQLSPPAAKADVRARSPVAAAHSSQVSVSVRTPASTEAPDYTMSKSVQEAWLSVGQCKVPQSSNRTQASSDSGKASQTSYLAEKLRASLTDAQDPASVAMSLLEQQLEELQGVRGSLAAEHHTETKPLKSLHPSSNPKSAASTSHPRSQAHAQVNNSVVSSSTNPRASTVDFHQTGSHKAGQSQWASSVSTGGTNTKVNNAPSGVKATHSSQYTGNSHTSPPNITAAGRDSLTSNLQQLNKTSPNATGMLSPRQDSMGFTPKLPTKPTVVSRQPVSAAQHKPVATVRASNISPSSHNVSVKITPTMSGRIKDSDRYSPSRTLSSVMSSKPLLTAAITQTSKSAQIIPYRQTGKSSQVVSTTSKLPATAVAKPMQTTSRVSLPSTKPASANTSAKSFGGIPLEEIQAQMLAKVGKPTNSGGSGVSHSASSPSSVLHSNSSNGRGGEVSPLTNTMSSPVWPAGDLRRSPLGSYSATVTGGSSNRSSSIQARHPSPVHHTPTAAHSLAQAEHHHRQAVERLAQHMYGGLSGQTQNFSHALQGPPHNSSSQPQHRY